MDSCVWSCCGLSISIHCLGYNDASTPTKGSTTCCSLTSSQSHIPHESILSGELIHSSGLDVLESQDVDLSHVQHYDLIAGSGGKKKEMEKAVMRKRIDLKGLLHKLLEMDVSSH